MGVDDCIRQMEWVMLFLQAQGYETETELFQDNMSTIRLKINGKQSSSQWTQHLNIKYFYITDQISKGWLKVKHCPTNAMRANFFTKPLTGPRFW